MTWLVAIAVYVGVLAIFLVLVGGVRRGDRLHTRSLQDLAAYEPDTQRKTRPRLHEHDAPPHRAGGRQLAR